MLPLCLKFVLKRSGLKLTSARLSIFLKTTVNSDRGADDLPLDRQ